MPSAFAVSFIPLASAPVCRSSAGSLLFSASARRRGSAFAIAEGDASTVAGSVVPLVAKLSVIRIASY